MLYRAVAWPPKMRMYCIGSYRKIPKISPWLIFSKAFFEGSIFGRVYIRKGSSTKGNLRFKIDWASVIVGSKFTAFALFYFVFEGNFPSTSPRGAYIGRSDLTEGLLRYRFGGLIFGGAYTWWGVFSEFYGIWSHLLPTQSMGNSPGGGGGGKQAYIRTPWTKVLFPEILPKQFVHSCVSSWLFFRVYKRIRKELNALLIKISSFRR